jgi:hypothetical protein
MHKKAQVSSALYDNFKTKVMKKNSKTDIQSLILDYMRRDEKKLIGGEKIISRFSSTYKSFKTDG